MRVLPVFVTFICGIAPVLYWLMQNKGGKMPPGPLGLPVLGYDLFISSEPHKQFRNLAKYYGSVFSIPLHNRYAVIIEDLPTIQNILSRRKDEKKKRRPVILKLARALFETERSMHHTVFEWFIEEITAFRDVQQKVAAEIKTLVGFDRKVTAADLAYMLYLRSVVLELFRWKTSPLLRCIWISNTDVMLGEYFIPKYSLLIANVWSINHNPKYFGEDVDSFKPERFLSKDVRRIIRENNIIPFHPGAKSLDWIKNSSDYVT